MAKAVTEHDWRPRLIGWHEDLQVCVVCGMERVYKPHAHGWFYWTGEGWHELACEPPCTGRLVA